MTLDLTANLSILVIVWLHIASDLVYEAAIRARNYLRILTIRVCDKISVKFHRDGYSRAILACLDAASICENSYPILLGIVRRIRISVRVVVAIYAPILVAILHPTS